VDERSAIVTPLRTEKQVTIPLRPRDQLRGLREALVALAVVPESVGLGGQLIERPAISVGENGARGKVVRRSRLGGMLNFYIREAA